MTEKQMQVVRYLRRCEATEGAMTVSEIAEAVGRTPSSVRDMLITMRLDGWVEKVGHAGNAWTYGLTQYGRQALGRNS